MASIKLTGDTSGEITISAPAVAGTNTLTLPANTGTIVTSASGVGDLPSTIAGPAFSAYLSANQSISNTTYTKLQIDTENFDTNSNYDNATNYRFTPTVAGYYQVGGGARFISLGDNDVFTVAIYKNGSLFRLGTFISTGGAMSPVATVSSLVYLNGSTDYIELYAYHNYGSARDVGSDNEFTRFEAVLVRAA